MDVHVSVIFAVRQALGGCSIAPVVMAETLNGMDMVSAVEGEFFRGAPIFLYMWLLERFWFVLTNQIPLDVMHDMGLFFWCPITYAFTRFSAGWTWLESTGYIRCSVLWWQLRSAVLFTGWQNYVMIRVLHRTSFYIPLRLLCQFNVL